MSCQQPTRIVSVVATPPSNLKTAESQGQQPPKSTSNSLDFIGPSQAVKSLFSVPYLTGQGVYVAVHNMGGTLLIDAANLEDEAPVQRSPSRFHRKRQRPSQKPQSVLPDNSSPNEALAVITSMLDNIRVDSDKSHCGEELSTLPLHPPEHYAPVSLPTEHKEYLRWHFRELQLLVGSDSLLYRADNCSLAVRIEETARMDQLLKRHEEMVARGEFIADHQLAELQQAGKPSYASALSRKRVVSTTTSSASFTAPNLDQVQLQTCIVPPIRHPLGSMLSSQSSQISTPICTVLDVYLDNLMANVPQLALCLQEKGLIQSVKLMETKDIPSKLIDAQTLDSNIAWSYIDTTLAGDPLFSPHIMEMNAATLLRFLKANCTRDNSTYLLRKDAGETNIQLYDISSISAQRQRKWIWWLSMMSYRFAHRLSQLARNPEEKASLKRDFRARQRSLLQNALNLLEDLADMDGGQHETLRSSVSENLADTFLNVEEDLSESKHKMDDMERPSAVASPPYANISVDALSKAQDHIVYGIKQLWPLLDEAKENQSKKRQEKPRVVIVQNEGCSSSDDEENDEMSSIETHCIASQLFGLHHKLINVSLRLAEHHLKNYWSSSAMQSLRTAARKIADAISLVELISNDSNEQERFEVSLKYQYTWLWEHCGHFARSFAADNLWRDRGHACGDDVISVLGDVEAAFGAVHLKNSCFHFVLDPALLSSKTKGLVSLRNCSSLVDESIISENYYTGTKYIEQSPAMTITSNLLDQQKTIQRDKRRVLVASCVCYSRCIDMFEVLLGKDVRYLPRHSENTDSMLEKNSSPPAALSLLRQRLGDACNEIGKILLDEMRFVLNREPTRLTDDGIHVVADILLFSAEFWFTEGLTTFNICNDSRNIALLRCNLCQCSKIRANSTFAKPKSNSDASSHAEVCLQCGAEHLQKAHEALCQRDIDPITWDMVSQELAATFLVLGVRRRQGLLGGGTTPVIMEALRINPGKERSIIDPMEKALHIYEELGNSHQAAAVHYQLALYYSKVWTCQRDEAKTRAKLASAFHHFSAAHSFFSHAPTGNEPTFVLLCLDLSNLYAVVSGEECLFKALSRCLDTANAFFVSDIPSPQWLEKMLTLASSVEEKVLKLLVSLVKIEKKVNNGGKYKEAYREALTQKMMREVHVNDAEQKGIGSLVSFHGMLKSIKDKLE